jgi:D-alanine-D-alanine ligase
MQNLTQKYGKVAVIMGGTGSEREISLMSGEKVLASLVNSGVNAYAFDPKHHNICQLLADKVDRAFLTVHGKHGEDGLLQGALEYLKIPYTNSGVLASSLAMDKYKTKLIWRAFDIPVATDVLLKKSEFCFHDFKLPLELPVVVKPVHDGSTLGLTKVYHEDQLEGAINLAFQNDTEILIEEMIIGDEFTITICEGEVLPAIKIEAPCGEYDYQNKYFTDDTRYICPANCGTLHEQINQWALTGYNAIGARGVARLDLMVSADKKVYFLEINTIPGMTAHSLVPMAFAAKGINFDQMCL